MLRSVTKWRRQVLTPREIPAFPRSRLGCSCCEYPLCGLPCFVERIDKAVGGNALHNVERPERGLRQTPEAHHYALGVLGYRGVNHLLDTRAALSSM